MKIIKSVLLIIAVGVMTLTGVYCARAGESRMISWTVNPVNDPDVVTGYRIFYSQSSVLEQCPGPAECENVDGVYYVDAGNVLEYTIENLCSGPWFFLVVTHSADSQSAFSMEVTDTIPEVTWLNKDHPACVPLGEPESLTTN